MEGWILTNLAAAPFLFGCVEPWAKVLLEISWFACAAALLAFRPGPIPLPPAALGALGLAALGWIQAGRPASAEATPAGFSAVSGWAASRQALLMAAYAAAGFACARVLGGRRAVRKTVWTLFLAGAAFAALGISQSGCGKRFLYWIREVPPGFSAFGPYYYKNHAGGFLAMAVCLGTGLICSRAAAFQGRRAVGERADFWASQAAVAAGVVLAGVGLYMSRSRGGFHSLVMGASLAAIVAVISFARGTVRYRWLAVLGVLGLAYATLLINFPWLVSMTEMGIVESGRARIIIWENTMEMLRHRPFFGFGLGGFAYAYPHFEKPESWLGGVVEHAHGDWLELLVTGGIPGLVLFSGGVLGQFAAGITSWRRWNDPEVRWLIGGILAAGASFAFHALGEHNFQAPANMAVFMAVLVLGRRPEPVSVESPSAIPIAALEAPHGVLIRGARFLTAVIACAGALAAARTGAALILAGKAESSDLRDRVALYERALKLDSDNPDYARGLAVGYLWLGEEAMDGRRIYAKRAMEAADRGLKSTPDQPDLLEAKGIAVWWMGNRAEGKALIARSKALKPWLRPGKKHAGGSANRRRNPKR